MKKVLIVGGKGGTHVGDAFFTAAIKLNLEAEHVDSGEAFKSFILKRKFYWKFLKHTPPKLKEFSAKVENKAGTWKPDFVLSTGLAPLTAETLEQMRLWGIQTFNYLTDDPWNASHQAPWFFMSLPCYAKIYTPRFSNIQDLKNLGCKSVEYLPFGYSPNLFFKDESVSGSELTEYTSDVLFAGGADSDRIPYMKALADAGFRLRLYGDFWGKYKETKKYYFGYADCRTLRAAIQATKIALCLVRRPNRDGNSMRTFEIPAVGACMLVEDTQEHRNIFGDEGEAALYFNSIDDMVTKAAYLLKNPSERQRLSASSHKKITNGKNTYQDRLQTMLS